MEPMVTTQLWVLKKSTIPMVKHTEFSINGGTPKWMVYNGQSYKNGECRASSMFILGHLHIHFYEKPPLNPFGSPDPTWHLEFKATSADRMYSWSWGDPRGLREQAWTEPANVPGAKQRRVFDNQETKQTLVAWSTTKKNTYQRMVTWVLPTLFLKDWLALGPPTPCFLYNSNPSLMSRFQ